MVHILFIDIDIMESGPSNDGRTTAMAKRVRPSIAMQASTGLVVGDVRLQSSHSTTISGRVQQRCRSVQGNRMNIISGHVPFSMPSAN